MSFVVSYNGQFKSYKITDSLPSLRVNQILKSNNLAPVKEDSTFKEEGGQHKIHKQLGPLNQYVKAQKNHQKQVLPHHARDIMTRKIYFLNENNRYQDAVNLMHTHNIRHIPILDTEKNLIGMISHSDMINIDSDLTVKEIMSKEVVASFETTTIQDLSRIMLKNKISALPIVDLNYKTIGIVTKSDILTFVTKIISVNGLF